MREQETETERLERANAEAARAASLSDEVRRAGFVRMMGAHLVSRKNVMSHRRQGRLRQILKPVQTYVPSAFEKVRQGTSAQAQIRQGTNSGVFFVRLESCQRRHKADSSRSKCGQLSSRKRKR